MKTTPVEELFTVLNETATLLQEELNCTYLEALAETGENMFHQSVLQDTLSELTVKRLKKIYEDIKIYKIYKGRYSKIFSTSYFKRNEGKCSTEPSNDARFDWNASWLFIT